MIASAFFACQANAGGFYTHYLQGKKALDLMKEKQHSQLLQIHHREYQNGMIFADAGYLVGEYGEFAHWGDFLNTYLSHIKGRCPSLLENEECQQLVAHYFGMVGHSLSDINFDRYFVREVARQNYNGDLEAAQTDTDSYLDVLIYAENPTEYAPLPPWAPLADLEAVLRKAGRPTSIEVMTKGLRYQDHLRRVGMYATGYGNVALTPISSWGAQHYRNERGGIHDTAQVLANAYDTLWGRLQGAERSEALPQLKFRGGWPDMDFWVE
jgi:hypothetical protein